jgi:hypothetical protein
LTINGKTIRGAYERIGDKILVTTIDAQKSVPLDGGTEEEVAQRTLSELFVANVDVALQSGRRNSE